MKKVLVVGATIGGNDAVSGIINSIIKQANQETIFYLFGYRSKSIIESDNRFKVDLAIKDPFENGTIWSIFYRPLRKLCYMRAIDDYKLSSLYAEKKLKEKCKDISFDLVVGVSGRFCFSVVAYRYAKKHGIRLKLVYFDPFVDNAYARSKRRKEQELVWIDAADQIFYNTENKMPDTSHHREKWQEFKIPIGNQEQFNNYHEEDVFVYGGSFYKGIREPDCLFDLAKKVEKSNYSVACYSNWNCDSDLNNLHFYPIIQRKEFRKVCENAKALIYIGNKGGNSTSSKYLEYIALKKPIIGINVEDDNEVKKYPLYFDWSDDNLLKKIDSSSTVKMTDIDIYSIYKERDPSEIAKRLFD